MRDLGSGDPHYNRLFTQLSKATLEKKRGPHIPNLDNGGKKGK